MTPPELARRRRCRALLLAVALGVLLPILRPDWPTLAVALVGIAAALVTYWRNCREG